MKSRASVTVMVTWVCVKDSSNIQSGWREGKVNLGDTEKTKSSLVDLLCEPSNMLLWEWLSSVLERFEEMFPVYRNRWNMVESSNSLWMAMPM